MDSYLKRTECLRLRPTKRRGLSNRNKSPTVVDIPAPKVVPVLIRNESTSLTPPWRFHGDPEDFPGDWQG
jgi:hypothetical protein